MAEANEVEGFRKFTEEYKKVFPVEKTAVDIMYC